jgi:hypothetical protein
MPVGFELMRVLAVGGLLSGGSAAGAPRHLPPVPDSAPCSVPDEPQVWPEWVPGRDTRKLATLILSPGLGAPTFRSTVGLAFSLQPLRPLVVEAQFLDGDPNIEETWWAWDVDVGWEQTLLGGRAASTFGPDLDAVALVGYRELSISRTTDYNENHSTTTFRGIRGGLALQPTWWFFRHLGLVARGEATLTFFPHSSLATVGIYGDGHFFDLATTPAGAVMPEVRFYLGLAF